MSQWPRADGGESAGTDAKPQDSLEPPKTVRCCIIDGASAPDDVGGRRGSGDAVVRRVSPAAKRDSTRRTTIPATESVRVKNHLEWKRQKEAEQAKRRDRERMEEARRKEEKEKEDRERRRREKEREEKVREWQEQKAREKEDRRREEMVLKALEQEIKGVTQTLDKEKLIHEWIRLKNKQKQLEAEKKAELLQKEEEARALRQSLAEISYRQWKERTKTRRIALPKNGYQIFGPKPVPVVKEDWNSDFANGSDSRDASISARTAKSVASTTSIRAPSFSQPVSSKSQLKIALSRTSVNDLPFRHLHLPPDVDAAAHKWKSVETFPAVHLPLRDEEPVPLRRPHAPAPDVLPTKTKLDLYLRPKMAPPPVEGDTLKNYLRGLGEANTKLIIDLTEKLSSSHVEEADGAAGSDAGSSSCRRSRSYDKPARRMRAVGARNPSRSVSTTLAAAATAEKAKKEEGKKRRKSVVVGGDGKVAAKTETAPRRKPLNRKCVKSEAVAAGALVDSPYCARRTRARSKANRTKED